MYFANISCVLSTKDSVPSRDQFSLGRWLSDSLAIKVVFGCVNRSATCHGGGGGKIIGVWTVSLAIPSRQRSHQQNGFQPHAVDRSCILPRRYRRLWCLFAPISYSEWICWKGFPRKRQMMKRDPRRRRGLVVWTSFFSKKKNGWTVREQGDGRNICGFC